MKRKVLVASLLLILVLLFMPAGRAQLEFSCTSSQNVAIQARLNALPAEDKTRFEGTAQNLEQDVAQLQEKGKKLEEDYLTIFYKERNALLEVNPEIRDKIIKDVAAKHPDLINQYAAAVASENAELAQRARGGDQDASRQINELVWGRLSRDPTFNAEFQNQAARNEALNNLLVPRLAANPAYDAGGARMVNFQQELNDKESAQDKFKSGLPSPDSDHLATEAATGIARQHGLAVDAVTNTRAFRDLLVTVDYADRIRDSGNEPSTKSYALQKFDNKAGQEATAAGLGDVLTSVDLVRGAMREVKGEALNVRLGFSGAHLGQYLPPPHLRADAMKNGQSELARSLVATTALLLNKETNVQQSIKLLEKIKIPPQASIDRITVPAPSTQSPSEARPGWVGQLASDMQKTSDLVFKYIVVTKKKD